MALHLALHCLGVGPGDEVIVPTFTYIASVNTIVQCGATPVFADSREGDWLLDPADVGGPDHAANQGDPPRPPLRRRLRHADARRHSREARGLGVVEDCAEAFGTTLDGRHVGTFGDVGTFSFFGNKTITTGEGGMVIAQDKALAERMRIVRGQGQSPTRRYWHEVLGFNYRMTNIVAAIGLAQIERLDAILARKRAIAARYEALLRDLPVAFQRPMEGVESSHWLVSVLLPPGTDRDALQAEMASRGVDTRPVFFCAHEMPMYAKGERFPVAESIAARGLSLPSYPTLADAELDRVADALGAALRAQGLA